MLIDGVRHFSQPGTVFEKAQNIRRAEEFDAVWRWIAKRLEQA